MSGTPSLHTTLDTLITRRSPWPPPVTVALADQLEAITTCFQDSQVETAVSQSRKTGWETQPAMLQPTALPRLSTPGQGCHHAEGGCYSFKQFRLNVSLQQMEMPKREQGGVITFSEVTVPHLPGVLGPVSVSHRGDLENVELTRKLEEQLLPGV